MHVINGVSPEYPLGEWDSIRAIGSYSKIDNVQVDETPHTPPTIVFGPEPALGWCYYYEKADLARQKNNWNQVLEFGTQAFDKKLSPTDPIEWLPFLQAYAQTGNVTRLKELAPTIKSDPDTVLQACHIINSMTGLSKTVTDTVKTLYCPK